MTMRINADFSKPAIVVPTDDAWVHSPEAGVDRLMLDRIGDEVARATSLVRYAPGSSFGRHEHAMGEEFLVLDGVFSDEHADYPTGTYVRNPPGTGHAPHCVDGSRIFVKLRQFDESDLMPVVIDTTAEEGWQDDVLSLHAYGTERVAMVRVTSGHEAPIEAGPGGVELLLVSGQLRHGGDTLPAESWLRFPEGAPVALTATADSVLWTKSGHLPSD